MFVVVVLVVGFGSWALGWVLDQAGDTIGDNGFSITSGSVSRFWAS